MQVGLTLLERWVLRYVNICSKAEGDIRCNQLSLCSWRYLGLLCIFRKIVLKYFLTTSSIGQAEPTRNFSFRVIANTQIPAKA